MSTPTRTSTVGLGGRRGWRGRGGVNFVCDAFVVSLPLAPRQRAAAVS